MLIEAKCRLLLATEFDRAAIQTAVQNLVAKSPWPARIYLAPKRLKVTFFSQTGSSPSDGATLILDMTLADAASTIEVVRMGDDTKVWAGLPWNGRRNPVKVTQYFNTLDAYARKVPDQKTREMCTVIQDILRYVTKL